MGQESTTSADTAEQAASGYDASTTPRQLPSSNKAAKPDRAVEVLQEMSAELPEGHADKRLLQRAEELLQREAPQPPA